MSSRVQNKTQPSFYLDHSTLCAAFRSRYGKTTAQYSAYARLLPWIERVARDANLVVSVLHVLELRRWGDVAAARDFARWLDGLPTVWAYAMPHVQAEEDENHLLSAFKLSHSEPVRPFAPAMLSTFDELTPESSVTALREPSALGLLQHLSDDPSIPQDVIRSAASGFREDAKRLKRLARAGWTNEELDRYFDNSLRALLHKRAGEAHNRLVAQAHPGYRALNPARNVAVLKYLEHWESESRALPLLRVFDRFTRGFRIGCSSQTADEKQSKIDRLRVGA